MTTAVAPTNQFISDPAAANGSGHAPQASPTAVSQRAVLVTLHIRNWSETATDQSATQQVADANNVSPGSGRYIKRLLNKHACEDVRRLGQDARKAHNDLTMPWDDQGTRLLPIKAYDRYKETISNLMERRQEATNRLIFCYSEHIQQAQNELGTLFNASDYPTSHEPPLRHLHGLGVRRGPRRPALPRRPARARTPPDPEGHRAARRRPHKPRPRGPVPSAPEGGHRRLRPPERRR